MKAAKRYALRAAAAVTDPLRGLHPQIKRKLRAALAEIIADPYAGKALKDEIAGLWRFRVGKFRIVYRMRQSTTTNRCVDLVACGPRERIYEETYRLVARGH